MKEDSSFCKNNIGKVVACLSVIVFILGLSLGLAMGYVTALQDKPFKKSEQLNCPSVLIPSTPQDNKKWLPKTDANGYILL